MKKTLLMLAALLCCCFALKAQDFTYENLNYHVTGNNPPTVELTGHTAGFAAHDFVIPSTASYGGTAYSVTSIGNSAFLNCSGLTGSLTIPNSVTSINYDAFYGCTNLTGSLTIGNSVTSIGGFAFYGCSGFTGSLSIPNSVTSIGGDAFGYCSGFSGSLTIPNSVKSIGEDAFYKCSGFTGSLVIPNSVESIGGTAFYECSGFTGSLTIGNSVTSIGTGAFAYCSGFTGSLTIPNSVTSIGGTAFAGCSGFTGSLTIPNSVTSIEPGAFAGCSGLTGSLTIPNSVTSIGERAFGGTGFTIIIAKPATPPDLGEYAFTFISNVESISVPCGSVEDYKGKEGWSYYKNLIKEASFLYELTATSANPELGSASITQYSDCTSGLSTVAATPHAEGCLFTGWTENGVEVSTANPYYFILTTDRNLVANFFWQYDFSAICTTGQTLYYRIIDAEQHLVSIVAPNNNDNHPCWDNFTKPTGQIELPETVTHNGISYTVTAIGDRAFYQCDNLTGSLTIPNSVTSIGDFAFASCSGFTGSLTIPNSVTNIEEYVFQWCSGLTGSLTIPNSVTSIGNYAFNNCSGLTGSLTIPNSVTSIGNYAFAGCSGLTGSLVIPNSVTSIGNYAFAGCSGFTGSLSIPNSVTSIGGGAFGYCSGFSGSLIIGKSVENIENYAFIETKFAHVIIKPTIPPMFKYLPFASMPNLQTITVPCSCVEVYKTSLEAHEYANMVKGGSFDYELTVASSNPEFGTASITQYSDCTNGMSTVAATPAENRIFTGWTENGVQVTTANPYSFTLNSDRNLVANFAEYTYVYEPIMSIPSPIDPDAVYVLGYQDGNDYYLHTSGTAAGEMRLSKNPENPIKYSFLHILFGTFPILTVNEDNYFTINSDGVFLSTSLDDNYDEHLITIQNGDISSQDAPAYTAYHDGDIIRSHEDSNEGNLRLFEVIAKPLYHIAVSSTPEGLGTATATCGGETVESALEGTSITVTATPAANCIFTGWTENGVQVSTANPYTFTLTSDCNLVANFYFSATCTTGQTLYYRIIDAEQHWVSIVAPNGDNVHGWDGYTKPTGDITLPETVTHNGTSYTVTAIGDQSFNSCFGLTGSLVIPNSVTSIGNDAFFRCSGFSSLTIGNSVTSIGADAFWECSGLTGSLTIPNSVESIGEYAFADLGYDGALTIGSSVTSIGVRAFAYSKFAHIIAKPTTPPTLGTNAFSDMTELLSITVPCGKDEDYKTATGWSSFDGKIEDGFVYELMVASPNPDFGSASIIQQPDCETQAKVTAAPNDSYNFANWTENGEVVSTANPYTFTLTSDRNLVANFFRQYDFSAACTTGQTLYYRIIDAEQHWVSIVAPNGDNANGWDSYTKPTGDITLPETVTHNGTSYTVTAIGDRAFHQCDNLTGSLTIPNSVTSIRNYAFNNCSGFNGSLTIPNSVTSIGNYAFNNCSGFNGSLTIPNSVTSIGQQAFANCSGFNGSLTIGNAVTSIGNLAFADCSGFNGSLTIGSSVTSIGGNAFEHCNFNYITSKNQSAPTLASYIPNPRYVFIPKNTTVSYEIAWVGYDYIFIEYDIEDYHFNGTFSNEWNRSDNWAEALSFLFWPWPCHNAFINADCIVNDVNNLTLHSVTVAAGKTLTIYPNTTLEVDLITLEDGAKLVNNGTVSCNDLTVKKAIEGYGTGTGGWYLVSSPVATTSLPVGMKADPAEDYDLYRFSQTGDEEGREWLNYKAESFGIENQNGYLYACKNDTTIIFHGDLAATGTKELEYDEGEGVDFPGFNLVGNPYPCNATISGTNLRSSNYYYKMNAAGTDLEVVAEPILAPCTGVFAVAANSNATVTFTQADATANVTRGEKSSLQDIRVELLADGKVIDRAYLNMNGESLPKFRLQDNASEICFYQDKEELAVVSTSSASGASTGSAGRTEMPLNFKAAKNGSYTITVNVDNADLNYLHLIDNLTGNDVDLMGSEGNVARNVSTYTFDAKTSDYASRFKLVFGVNGDAASADSAGDFAYISNGNLVIDSIEGQATLQIIDALGRVINSEIVSGSYNKALNVTPGLYILNLNGMTQKIVVE